MAFASKSFFFMVLLCLLLLLQVTDVFSLEENTLSCCSSMKENSNRKLLMMVNGLEAKEAVLKIDGKGKNEDDESWELRAAPLGPDPLHHHGADPKPRTP
ncbi:uncharacterized protein [Rutidosis leptorrhynchoides]|uniref:uncharacterized protein n=1 Tax=Rutidosis leptorrhynchoides TaxID=125765 RepID=UPI003A992CF9